MSARVYWFGFWLFVIAAVIGIPYTIVYDPQYIGVAVCSLLAGHLIFWMAFMLSNSKSEEK